MTIFALQRISFQTINAFKHNILEATSTLNKKVIAVAVIAFGLLVAAWFAVRHYQASQAEQAAHIQQENQKNFVDQLKVVEEAKKKVEAEIDDAKAKIETQVDEMQAQLKKLQRYKNDIIDLRDDLLAIKTDDDTSIQAGIAAFEKFAKRKFTLIKSDPVVQFEQDAADIQAQIDKMEANPEKSELDVLKAQVELSQKYNQLVAKLTDHALRNEIVYEIEKLATMRDPTEDELIAFTEQYLSLFVSLGEIEKSTAALSAKVDALTKK